MKYISKSFLVLTIIAPTIIVTTFAQQIFEESSDNGGSGKKIDFGESIDINSSIEALETELGVDQNYSFNVNTHFEQTNSVNVETQEPIKINESQAHDHAHEIATDHRRSEIQDSKVERSKYNQQSGVTCANGPQTNKPEIKIAHLSQEITEKDNELILVSSLPKQVPLSYESQQLLRKLGIRKALDVNCQLTYTLEQTALFAWINHVVNRATELYKLSTDWQVKLVLAETVMMCAAAHDLVSKGEIRKAADLLKLGYSAVCKYERFKEIAGKSAFRRVVQIAYAPHRFIYDQVKGIGNAAVAFGRGIYYLTRWKGDRNSFQEFIHAISSNQKNIANLSHAVAQLSDDEWDIIIQSAGEAVGEQGADLIASSLLFGSVSKVFSSIEKVARYKIPAEELARLKTPPGRMAHQIQLVFDETAQAFVMEEKLLPAIVGLSENNLVLESFTHSSGGIFKFSKIPSKTSTIAPGIKAIVNDIDHITTSINHPVLNFERTGSALKLDEYHDFHKIVDNFGRFAQRFDLIGNDKILRDLYQIEGSLNGKVGIFEWIVDYNVGITHRLFIPNGQITGKPNIFPRK